MMTLVQPELPRVRRDHLTRPILQPDLDFELPGGKHRAAGRARAAGIRGVIRRLGLQILDVQVDGRRAGVVAAQWLVVADIDQRPVHDERGFAVAAVSHDTA